MSRDSMLTVFCYDISDDRNRTRAAKILENYASRVQYSVFEARMRKKQANQITARLIDFLEDGDSLRVYVIGRNGERRTQVFGDGPPLETDENYWLL